MARLKVLKQKDKRYVFRVFGNEDHKEPAICVFKRFPQRNEDFFSGDTKSITEGLEINANELRDNRDAALQKIVDRMYKSYMDNIAAMRIDYNVFARECIEGFENFSVESTDENGKIAIRAVKTVNELLSFSDECAEGVHEILRDCYKYANERDEFTMGE